MAPYTCLPTRLSQMARNIYRNIKLGQHILHEKKKKKKRISKIESITTKLKDFFSTKVYNKMCDLGQYTCAAYVKHDTLN